MSTGGLHMPNSEPLMVFCMPASISRWTGMAAGSLRAAMPVTTTVPPLATASKARPTSALVGWPMHRIADSAPCPSVIDRTKSVASAMSA